MSGFALKILLVEDNDELREATLAFLQNQGHFVRGVSAAEELGDLSGAFVPDVYVIDLNLPDEDGLSLVKRLRGVHPNVGIVITTARTQIGDRVAGYESGADIYLPKPVAPPELMASISALAKRVKAKAPSDRGLRFHAARLMLSGPAGQAELTGGEAELLSALIRAPGQTLERWQLSEIIAGGGAEGDLPAAAALEMRVARLRKKLADAGAEQPSVKALRKLGYQLCCSVILE
ncbi:response regulator transcription factor [Aquabacterium sp.]|uniref:response regulator transcription factor n=1 Tax=Aquabacterium sp. TaxID=1872578 RepID=UPI003CFE05A1